MKRRWLPHRTLNATARYISYGIILAAMCFDLGSTFAQTDFSQLLQLAKNRYGLQAMETIRQWRELINANHDRPELEKIAIVNDFFNQRIRFSSDAKVWNQSDYWATPLETMARLQGDCEDFSIAKYITLLQMGVPIKKLHLTYVRAQIGNSSSKFTQAHMVLGYYPQPRTEPLLLDNLIAEILPASRRPDLTPVFSFNSEGLWAGGSSSLIINNPTARLSRWRDVLSRMQQEGLK